MAALAGLTLSVAAQTGDDGADDADPQGRIIARIQDRTDDDGVDDYRIEFGFFPEWAMEDKDPWAEAITTWSDWLPRARYLTKTVIDRRDADDNRRWLRSSLISVPASAPAQRSGGATGLEDGAAGQNLIEGRVIARYNPDSQGRLRVEFGFLPENAFTSTSNTEEAVEQYGEDLLPRARYLSATMIESRRGVWLRSSVVDLTTDPEPPVIGSISCSPALPRDGDDVTCTASLSGGTPDTYSWSGGYPSSDQISPGSQPSYTTRFFPTCVGGRSGSYTVSLTVSNTAGSDSDSTTVVVFVGAPKVVGEWPNITLDRGASTTISNVSNIFWVLGSPPSVYASSDDSDVATAETDGPANSAPRSFTVTAVGAGSTTIRVTVSDCGGSATQSFTVTVEEPTEPPEITRISCLPSSPNVNQSVTCTASLSGGTPTSYSWSGGDSGGEEPTYTTTFSTLGSKTVSLTASNSIGSDSKSLGVTVGNRPPIWSRAADYEPIDNITLGYRAVGCLSDKFRDPDGDSLTFTARSTAPTVASVSLTDEGCYVVTTLRLGLLYIEVTATDPHGASVLRRLRVEVLPPPPVIDSISCSPSSPKVKQPVTCTASLSGGEPRTYAWSGGDSSGEEATYSTTFSTPGSKTVSLTASNEHHSVTLVNAGGSDTKSITVVVTGEGEPVIDSISCTPSSPRVDQSVTCTASLSGGTPDSYSWSDSDGGSSSGPRETTYRTSFRSSGTKTVRLTARNSADSDSRSTTVIVNTPPELVGSIADITLDVGDSQTVDVRGNFRDADGDRLTYEVDSDNSAVRVSASSSRVTVEGRRAGSATITVTANDGNGGSATQWLDVTVEGEGEPVIDSISCTPSSPRVDQSVTCTASLSGGTPTSYLWSGGSSSDTNPTTTYSTSFSSSGDKTVRLTVRNSAGSDTGSATVSVPPPGNISCVIRHARSGAELSAITLNQRASNTVTPNRVPITVTCSDPAGDDNDLVLSSTSGDSEIGWVRGLGSSYTTFRPGRSYGATTVTITATAPDGRTGSASVSVTSRPVTGVVSVSCSPSSPEVDETVTCTADLDGSPTPDSYSWSGGTPGDSDPSPTLTTYSTRFSSVGDHTVRLTVRNDYGNDGSTSSGNQTTVTVVRGAGKPVINSISCSPSSPTVSQSVTCTANLSGDSPTNYSWSGGVSSDTDPTTTYNATFSTPGSQTVSLTVSNSAGSDNKSATLSVKSRRPNCGLGRGLEIAEGGSATISYTCSDPDGDTLIITATSSDTNVATVELSSSTYTFSMTVTITGVSAGRAVISLVASDGTWEIVNTADVVVVEGPTPPVIDSISCTPSSPRVNQSVTCTASLSGGTPTSYSWSGGVSSDSDPTTIYNTTFGTSGNQTVSLTASNAGGSDSDTYSVTVTEPPEAPTINSISCSPSSPRVDQSVSCTADIRGTAPISYSWSGGSSSGSSASYSTSFSSSGSKTVSLRVSNSEGSDSDSTTVVVPPPPPDISVSCPSAVAVNQNFTCTVSNSGGAIDTYSWSDSAGGSGRSSSYSTNFRTEGTYTVSLTASNAGGSDSDTYRSITVIVEQRPRISISCPSSGEVDVNITCTVSNSGGSIRTYEWTGGSSSNSSSSSYRTSFSSSGSKRVWLVARNTAGSDKDNTLVLVVATPPSTQYGRCGSDAIRVYYFERSTYTKRWLNMTWEEVAARVPGWGEHMIGHMRQSDCNSWPNGTNLTTSNWPPQP